MKYIKFCFNLLAWLVLGWAVFTPLALTVMQGIYILAIAIVLFYNGREEY